MNNQIMLGIVLNGTGDTKIATEWEKMTPCALGGTIRKPCQHGIEVCADCLDSWSIDHAVKITPGLVRTFLARYDKFPFELIYQPFDGTHWHHLIIHPSHRDEILALDPNKS